MILPVAFVSPLEDLKRLSDRLVEVNATNMQLRLKLGELEALEVSVKVHIKVNRTACHLPLGAGWRWGFRLSARDSCDISACRISELYPGEKQESDSKSTALDI